jgi:hypothetical protein
MLITDSSLVSGMYIVSSCSTAHLTCYSTKPSSVSERFSSSPFSSLDSACETMLFPPEMWTCLGPYYSRRSIRLAIQSFDNLPYKIFKWSVCTTTC